MIDHGGGKVELSIEESGETRRGCLVRGGKHQPVSRRSRVRRRSVVVVQDLARIVGPDKGEAARADHGADSDSSRRRGER
jgi:hypothetical protein